MLLSNLFLIRDCHTPWKFDNIPDFPETYVTWELEQIKPNKTKVKLAHIGFTGKEKGNFSIESHEQGWTEALDKLAKYSESLPPNVKN